MTKHIPYIKTKDFHLLRHGDMVIVVGPRGPRIAIVDMDGLAVGGWSNATHRAIYKPGSGQGYINVRYPDDPQTYNSSVYEKSNLSILVPKSILDRIAADKKLLENPHELAIQSAEAKVAAAQANLDEARSILKEVRNG
jgi:hypothetical protein